ncbi:MAG: hypothetical protein COZ18_02450, partial [Flexibacter sp. CG_4_10_14_3_um_filter_32_15]
MRIKSIHIKGLFDTFEHFIPFNQEDRITIIHAPNGFGKTIILKMLYGLLKMEFSIFEKVPFDSFIVVLDNENKIEILQQKELFSNVYEYTISFSDKTNDKLYYQPSEKDYRRISKIISMKTDFRQIGENTWISRRTNEKLTTSEIQERYFPHYSHFSSDTKMPDWYKTIQDNLNIHFIETQRLLVIDRRKLIRTTSSSNSEQFMTNSVKRYASELKEMIESVLDDYTTISQNLERSFPNRLITQEKQEKLTIESIKNELNNLEERRKKLQEVGLWDKEKVQDVNFKIPENIEDSSLNVLALYIKDVKEKLSVFDSLERKITLFKSIINSRFQFKNVNIEKKLGFSFLTDKGEELDSNDLSSGEQHQLVLLYEMLFKVKENDLVLLDEPEISLHITWQEKFWLSDNFCGKSLVGIFKMYFLFCS